MPDSPSFANKLCWRLREYFRNKCEVFEIHILGLSILCFTVEGMNNTELSLSGFHPG